MITEENPSKRLKTGYESHSMSSSAATVIANVWQTIEPNLRIQFLLQKHAKHYIIPLSIQIQEKLRLHTLQPSQTIQISIKLW